MFYLFTYLWMSPFTYSIILTVNVPLGAPKSFGDPTEHTKIKIRKVLDCDFKEKKKNEIKRKYIVERA